MKRLTFLLLLIFLFSYCKKEKNNDPVIPPAPPPAFSIPATEDIVMYEVNLRALSPTGDIQGVISRLDAIKTLGANVIWLMPIHPIGEINSVNSPYSVKNYKEVNPEFGGMIDLQTLVKEAHKKDIAVILDWVANHTAWDNPWIVNKDWYTQDGQGNIIHPAGTNWEDVADLNYDNQEMRLSMIDAMEYWVETADIDGFRCDAADWIPFDFWVQAIDSVSHLNDSLIWLAEGARLDHFTAGFQMNYAWDYYAKLKDIFNEVQPAAGLILAHNLEYKDLPEGKHKLRFTTNHDESAWDATPMVLFHGEQGALAASVATICLGGVPLIYGSQEVGQEQNVPFFSNYPINWSQHPEMLEEYQDIFKIYNGSKALKIGDLANYSNTEVLAFKRVSGLEEVLVIANLRNKNVTYNLPAALKNTQWNNAFDETQITLTESLDLSAYQYLILQM